MMLKRTIISSPTFHKMSIAYTRGLMLNAIHYMTIHADDIHDIKFDNNDLSLCVEYMCDAESHK